MKFWKSPKIPKFEPLFLQSPRKYEINKVILRQENGGIFAIFRYLLHIFFIFKYLVFWKRKKLFSSALAKRPLGHVYIAHSDMIFLSLYIYIYIYVCVCLCVYDIFIDVRFSYWSLISITIESSTRVTYET